MILEQKIKRRQILILKIRDHIIIIPYRSPVWSRFSIHIILLQYLNLHLICRLEIMLKFDFKLFNVNFWESKQL